MKSYVSLLCDDTYFYGIILLLASMRQAGCEYPLHVLVTDNVSESTYQLLQQLDITTERIKSIKNTQQQLDYNKTKNARMAGIWENVPSKLQIFNLTQFEKIIYLDADIYVLKNLDHLFAAPHLTAALDGEYFNLWENNPHFNAGCMVIEPSKEEYEKLLDYFYSATEMDGSNLISDQEVMNQYYDDWPKSEGLHLNKYYNVFAPYTQDEQIEDLKKNCYFIHFVGRKPWTVWHHNPLEHYSEYFYTEAANLIREEIKKIDITKVYDSIKLCVYAICKNERNRIEQWVDCFTEADYVCVLDTGSTDGTWEYLCEAKKKYKNLIIKSEIISPWRFDTARNESMKLIPKDTVMYFMADIDECIEEKGWADKVRRAWDPQFSRGVYKYNRNVADDGTVLRTIDEFRIHSKFWDHWENIVHEALYNKCGEKHFYFDICTPIDITVWHYSQGEKTDLYIELCEKGIEEQPGDDVMRLQLAIEYEIGKKWKKAFEHYDRLVRQGNKLQYFERARCYAGAAKAQLYGMGNEILAKQYFAEGRLYCASYFDNYIDEAEYCYNNGEYNRALVLCEQALKNCNGTYWCSMYDINGYIIFEIAGLSALYLKKFDKAVSYLSLVAYIDNNLANLRDEAIKQYLIQIKKQENLD